MGNKLTKRDRKKLEQREITKNIKSQLMQRGDKRIQTNKPQEIDRQPISCAKENRLKLEDLTQNELEHLVKDKCMHSSLYYKEEIEASNEPFKYDGFNSNFGLKLEFKKGVKEHYFGFELVEDLDERKLIKVHYNCLGYNEYKVINPKKLSARLLLNMTGEYQ